MKFKAKDVDFELSSDIVEMAIASAIKRFQYASKMKKREGTTEQKLMMVNVFLETNSEQLLEDASIMGIAENDELRLGAVAILSDIFYDGILIHVLNHIEDVDVLMSVKDEYA
jgi:hypothetical protein